MAVAVATTHQNWAGLAVLLKQLKGKACVSATGDEITLDEVERIKI